MEPSEVQSRTLHRAVEIVGGPDVLAKILGVPESGLRMWLDGRPVPSEIFLRAVDLIIDRDIQAQTDAAASQQRREA